jgi:hypothetical protein
MEHSLHGEILTGEAEYFLPANRPVLAHVSHHFLCQMSLVLCRPNFVPEIPINPQDVLGCTNRMGEPRGGGFWGMLLINSFALEQLIKI